MKKMKSIFALLVMALVGLSLTACSNDDLDTNQYQGGVSLNAYGPNPVMRGGQLRFIGSNLDQIASVTIPGVSPITQIEVVQSGIPSEIRITVPHDGPEPGLLTLTTKTDQTIKTKTELNYIEGIEITNITAEAMPGDVIKIEGDYLNLIQSLAFTNDVLVSETAFTTHDRYTIEVVVPENAKTGKIELYTADLTVVDKTSVEYQIVQTEDAIIIGTPAIAKVKGRQEVDALGTITAKKGEDITITGTYFNIVDHVTVGGYEVTELNVSDDGNTLTFTLPDEAPSGDLVLVCKSGVEVPVATLETVKPTNTVATPNPVKAGEIVTVNGDDMDVVTAIEFTDAEGEYTISLSESIVNTTQAFAVTVPAEATEGNLLLVMANGERIEVPFTLVKPTVTGYNVNPVNAGAALTIQGTDLDLVKKVQFGEGSTELTDDALDLAADGSSINIRVPMDALSGAPTLTLENGTTVQNVPDITVNEALFCYITESLDFDEEHTPKAGSTLTVAVAHGDKLQEVQVDGKKVNHIYVEDNSTLIISIPTTTGSTAKVKLVSSNGEVEYEINVIPQGSITRVIFDGPFELTWATSTQGMIAQDAMDNLPDGAQVELVFHYTVTGDNPQLKANNGSWGHIEFATGLAPANETIYALDPAADKLSFALSATTIANLKAASTDWGGLLIVHGQGATLNQITLEITIPMEKNLADFVLNMDGSAITYPYTFTWGDGGRFTLTPEVLSQLKVKKGSKFLVYKEAANTGQVQINNASWNAIYYLADWNGTEAVLEQEFDDALMDAVNNGGLILQGDLTGISKIAILP